jgi:cation diffusion facilitator CzcD-associated flavoprotein CzcO
MKKTQTLIVGSSISGLACAGALTKAGLEYTMIERAERIAMPWRNHYDRLHLHTSKHLSELPYKKYPAGTPRYPSRLQVIEYLDNYQKQFKIAPLFNAEATSIRKEGERWIIETSKEVFQAENVIMATGPYGNPRTPDFRGMETFTGNITHSSRYKKGDIYKGQKILVVGFGNSACEIALDLHEQGAYPSLSVRSAVNVLPRDIFGIPILQLGLLFSALPPAFADKLNAPLIKALTGDIRKLGLKKLPYGPLEQIHKHQTVPLLDIGTLKLIKDGNCRVFEGIENIEGKTVCFSNGAKEEFDSIVAAIGYEKGFGSHVLKADSSRFEDLDVPVAKQKYFGKDGLYFCGFYVSPNGQIREIASDAKKIAGSIVKNGSKRE